MTLLGVPMSGELKERIKKASDLDDRKMADWARLALRDAADRVLAEHDSSSSLKVADDPHPYKSKSAKKR